MKALALPRSLALLVAALLLAASAVVFVAPPVSAATRMEKLANTYNPVTVIDCATPIWAHAIKVEARAWQMASGGRLHLVYENSHGECAGARDSYCDWRHTCVIFFAHWFSTPSPRYSIGYHSPRMVWMFLNSKGRNNWASSTDAFQRLSAAGAALGRALGVPAYRHGSTVMNPASRNLLPGTLGKAWIRLHYRKYGTGSGGGSW